MPDAMKSVDAWVRFAGCVLVVAVLYWAQAVLVPLSLAVLLTFVLTPLVMWLQRRIGRLAAVFTVVILVFTSLGLTGYVIYRQVSSLGEALPTYTANIRAKIRDVRGAQSNGSVEKLSKSLEAINQDLGTAGSRAGTTTQPVVVTTEPVGGLPALGWLGPFVEPIGTAGFVITLVLFMLLEREALRDRLVGLFGHGRLATTTKAMDEAGRRVSRQLLLQTLVNVAYGTLAVVGLYLLGVPYPLFWGALGAALRFVPYLGPIIAAGGPIVLALAALPGWTRPLEVAGFYVVLELFTNLVLETVLYAGAAGISQVALLVAVAFWTWLWGPLGLVMATPLTVCIIVVGKHVRGLELLGRLLSDAPALSVDVSYYQRVLAGDEADAADLVERFVQAHSRESAYDGLLLPALNYAERDRLEERLSPEEEASVVETTRDMLEMLDEAPGRPVLDGALQSTPSVASASARVRVLGYAANGVADELALRMLQQLLEGTPIALDIASTRWMASEFVSHVRQQDYAVVCIADLPPSPPSKTRYLVKKLRMALPDVRIAVGRWAAAGVGDESLEPLTEVGASHVASSLLETRKYLAEAANVSLPAPGPAAAATPAA